MNITTEKIEARAYDFYVNRGENGGNQLYDWLKAEMEIREESTRTYGDSDRRGRPLFMGTAK